jgi:hypothetical protein
MSSRVADKRQFPPVGGPVKLPSASMPIPVPESRVERDKLELSRLAAKKAEDKIDAQIDYDRAVLEARGDMRRRANLEPLQNPQLVDASSEEHEAAMAARTEERRKANLAPTTSLAAKYQGVNNKDVLAKINVRG